MNMTSLIILTLLLGSTAISWIIPTLRRRAWIWAFILPVVTLIWASTSQLVSMEIPALLMGSALGLESNARILIILTAMLWICAALYGTRYIGLSDKKNSYWFYFTLTMIGNLGLLIALDASSFLLAYTLMSIAAYGLITYDRSPGSLYAGKIYIVMTILGEMIIFLGLSLAAFNSSSMLFTDIQAAVADSPHKVLITGLILAGFGIKLGIMPLHVWLPLAHPAAPVPASAVLSAVIIKTGLVGMMKFLPLGITGVEILGQIVIVLGLFTAFVAALIGAGQSNPKSVLAYSSVSQMGLIAVGMGTALMAPASWPYVLPALIFFAVHHAFAKGALFLGFHLVINAGKDRITRAWHMIALAIPALALAGLPITTGFIAKTGLKSGLYDTPWATALGLLLPLTSITTTLVMARLLYLVWNKTHDHGTKASPLQYIPWLILTAGSFMNWLLLQPFGLINDKWVGFYPESLWTAVWPIGLAGIMALVILKQKRIQELLNHVRIPQGDLLVPLVAMLLLLRGIAEHWGHSALIRKDGLGSAVDRGLFSIQQKTQHLLSTVRHRDSLYIPMLCLTIFILILLAVQLPVSSPATGQ